MEIQHFSHRNPTGQKFNYLALKNYAGICEAEGIFK